MSVDQAHFFGSVSVSNVGAGGAGSCLPRPVEAVVFDLDGTLLDTEPLYSQAFYAALAECGYSLPAEAYDRLVGLPSTTRRVLLPGMISSGFQAEPFFHAYYRHRSRLTAQGVLLKPGAARLLDRLAAADIPCAVATSASAATAAAHVGRPELAGRFAAVVTRDDVAQGKPAPDSFLAAASAMGVAPACCLALEDSDHGVHAASAAGMMVVMVPDTVVPTAETLERCCARVASLDEVTALMTRELASQRGR